MMRYFSLLSVVAILAIALGSCASTKPIPLPAGFWARDKLKIGVVLGHVPEPEVKIVTTSTSPGAPRTRVLIRDSDEHGGHGMHPELRADARKVSGYLLDKDEEAFMLVQERFVKALKGAGLQASAVHRQEGKTAPDSTRGFDALLILDCSRYGAQCHYTDLNQDFTDVRVNLEARMIDSATQETLWRAEQVRIVHDVTCRCTDQECYPVIYNSLKSAADYAGSILLRDLFRSRP